MIGEIFKWYDRRIFKKITDEFSKRWAKDTPRRIKIPLSRKIFEIPEKTNIKIKKVKKNLFDISFESPVSTDYKENNTAFGSLYLLTRFENPLLVFLPGWCFKVNKGMDFIHRYLTAGKVNLLTYEPPYHSRRTPRNRYSGELAVTWDTIRTLEGVLQAVLELRILVNFFKNSGVKEIGIMGASYGGWIGSLLLTVEKNLDFALLIEPVLRPDRVAWEYKGFEMIKKLWERKPHREMYERRLMSFFTPVNFPLSIPKEKVRIFVARYDEVSRVSDAEEISKKWGVKYKVYSAGHITLFLSPFLQRDIKAFFKK